ncbi:hyoscyamine 6-dioxygenase-like [Cynara cardunculus var. scolymus]|uniref:hyoscyamine 6-dioxygenase-like n=1 Tax=Cynara cardunculus var. scolymus TaxID=59895 RepID=UPI000D62EC61|nr:hyoscyamine 6-dioxygenase-like [Cynara cardunculus var. scolymus]
MALLVSSWSNGIQSVPKDYVMPPERRPGDFVSVCNEIPVIDLQENPNVDRSQIVQQILKASQEFGLFQVINHGVSAKMMEDIRVLYDEFFNMSIDDKLGVYSETFGTGCTLYTSGLDYAKEDVHYWKDTLKHRSYPLEEHTPSWPEKPVRYREEVGKYVVEVRKVAFKILDLIGEGLGLKEGHFIKVSQEQAMAINYYPPCPDPSLAMGIGGHTDPNLITFLQQDQYGLQIHKDGKWMGIDPIPNAFVVNLGYQLEIISNGKLKGVEHRGVTSSTAARTSIVTFFGPDPILPVVVEPAKELVTSNTPQMFKSYQYNNFIADYLAYLVKPLPRTGTPLDPYRL